MGELLLLYHNAMFYQRIGTSQEKSCCYSQQDAAKDLGRTCSIELGYPGKSYMSAPITTHPF
jgi:hypothetical protein